MNTSAQPTLRIQPSAEFAGIVTISTHDARQPAAPPALASLGVVIRNVSAAPIAAVMAKVSILRGNKTSVVRWFLRHSFDSTVTVLQPSQQYIVTPFGMPVARLLEGGTPDEWSHQAIEDAMEESRHWKEVTAEIDSVLDVGGRLRGKDSADSLRLFSEWLRADRDLAMGLLALRDKGGDPVEINRLLEKKPANSAPGDFLRRDHYGKRWNQRVAVLLRQFNVSGSSALFAEAERLRALCESRVVVR